MIAPLLQAERLGHGSGVPLVVGNVLSRLEEGGRKEGMCRERAGHNNSELMVNKASGRPMAGLVGRGKWGGAWATC